jgi:hypothetical protein
MQFVENRIMRQPAGRSKQIAAQAKAARGSTPEPLGLHPSDCEDLDGLIESFGPDLA